MPTSSIAGANVVAHVISTENVPDAPTILIRIEDGHIVSREELGQRVIYGSTDTRLIVLGTVDGRNLLRTWSLSDGKELTRSVVERMGVQPITPRIGAFAVLELDGQSEHVLYSGFKQILIERELEAGVLRRTQPAFALAGIELRTGEPFEVQTPIDTRAGWGWQAFGEQWGATLKDNSFHLYDPETRSLRADSPTPLMNAETFVARGLGVLDTNAARQVVRLTDAELRPLPATQVIAEAIDGSRRFRMSPMGTPVVVEAIRHGDQPLTTVTVREVISRKQLFQRDFQIRMTRLQVSNDARVWMLDNTIDKHAVRFGWTTETAEEIDYSTAEMPTLLVSLAPDDPR